MIRGTSRWIGRGINNLLSLVGLQLNRKKPTKKKERSKEEYIWQKASFLPKVPTIIDIGIGPKATPGLYKHFPGSRYVFIDPLEECRLAVSNYLQDSNNIFIASAVGSINTSAVFNVARKPSRSSFFKRGLKKASYKAEPVERREVPVQKLDDLISGLFLKTPLGIKIDTEGYELEVLRGTRKSLEDAAFVIVEFHFSDAILNAYTLQDIISLMENAGFYAYCMLRDGRNIVFLNGKFSPKE